MIKLGFFGAAGEVTGSCYILRTSRATIMVDMGMHQGEDEADAHNRRLPDIDPTKIDAVVLTHAHLDHCGRLPLLIKGGYRGPIYCTPASAELAEIILRDSAQLQSADCERFNRRLRAGDEPCREPLYSIEDVEGTLRSLKTMAYGQSQTIAPGIRISFTDAGHILGSGSVHMEVIDGDQKKAIVFSGDIGVSGSPILRDPSTPVPADVVVMESTYGDRDHRTLEATRAELLEVLKYAQEYGGKVIIPAFAVGRTQDLVYHIGDLVRSGKLSGLNVFVDSPMAVETTDLYVRHKDVYDQAALQLLQQQNSPLRFPGLTFTRSMDESKRLNTAKGSMVIISASGMCTGGRILHHLYHNLYKPETNVVFVGYQGQGTLGRRLVDGQKKVRIFREEVLVRARVHTLGGFSAHAGKNGLLNWALPLTKNGHSPRFFLTHGEDKPRQALQQALAATMGVKSELPQYGDIVTL